jgi:type IV pilus assembly protein PilM
VVNEVDKGQRISLIVKDHVIRYVQSKFSKNGLLYKSYGERFLPSGIIDDGKIMDRETFIMILEECVSDWKIKRMPLLFTVPDTSVVVRRVEVNDDIPDLEVKGHLYLQLGDTLHLPFEQPIFDISIVGQQGGKKDVVLVAAPEELISEYHEVFDEVKLKPAIADLSSLAIYRLYYHLDYAVPRDHLLSLQLSIDSMNMTIYHDHAPVFTRHLRLQIDDGKWELDRDSVEEKEIKLVWNGSPSSIEHQLTDGIRELERVLSFYRFSLTKGKAEVSKLLLTGDHPNLSLFIAKCRESFNLPIQTMQDREVITKSGQAIPARYYENIGLSLK